MFFIKKNYITETDNVIKEVIFPLAKKDGFKRHDFNFCKSVNDIYWVFNFQKSKWNTKNKCGFYINLGIFYLPIYEMQHSNLNKPNFPKEYNCCLRKRIGELKEDFFKDEYVVFNKKQLKELRNVLVNDYNNFVIPFLNNFNNVTDLENYFVKSDKIHDIFNLLFLFRNDKDKYNEIKIKIRKHKAFLSNKYFSWEDEINKLEEKFNISF